MTLRPMLTALAVACLLAGAACSGDDDASSTTTAPTTEADDGAGDATSSSTSSSSTIPDDEFSEDAARVSAAIDAAGDDICALAEAGSGFGRPGTPEQVKQAVDLYVKAYDAFARLIEPVDAEAAEALRQGMAGLRRAAEDADYDVSVMDPANVPEALSTDAFLKATEAVSQMVIAQCAVPGQDIPGATTVPGTGEGEGEGEGEGD